MSHSLTKALVSSSADKKKNGCQGFAIYFLKHRSKWKESIFLSATGCNWWKSSEAP